MADRKMKPPGGECHDLWGASFNGSPSHLRVLKPPGGGSSDIFGSSGDGGEPQRRGRNHNISSFSLGGEEVATPARKPEVTQVSVESVSTNGSTSSTESTPAPTPTPTASAPNKTRVPPGGFSSGLW